MPDIGSGLTIGSTIFGSMNQADAASEQSAADVGVRMAGIDAQKEQFAKIQELLRPYVDRGVQGMNALQPYSDAGQMGLQRQMALSGLGGPGQQRAEIDALSNSPEFQALMQQGESGILQNASATGGLRGGNVQGALAQFRPAMLQQQIQEQLRRYGGFANAGLGVNQGLVQTGQAGAAGVGAAGSNFANNQSSLLSEIGGAQAAGIKGQAQAMQGIYNIPAWLAGRGVFGGNPPVQATQ